MSEIAAILESIKALESQRAILGDLVVDTAVTPLKKRLKELETESNQKAERKYATVLFADVVNFTAMSETMDAEEVNDTINELWSYIDKIIIDRGGFVDKHIGDAIMALFGVEKSKENDPMQAVNAALEMQKIMQSLPVNKRLKKPLMLRIGINTGSLILSNVGSNNEFTAMGDTVNVASRLEHASPIGSVLISDETYAHVRNLFHTEKQDLLTVKGKKEPVQTYEVLKTIEREFYQTNRGLQGIEQKLVGRKDELKELKETFRKCQDNKVLNFSILTGEAGVGKTRLMKEFSRNIVSKTNSKILFSRAMEHEKTQPFSFVRNIIRNLFEILESDSLELVTEKIEKGFLQLLGEDSIEKAHFIGYLAGYDFSKSSYIKGIIDDPKQIHDIAIHYFTLFIQSFYSVTILLDDIHWFDEKSLWILNNIIQECRNKPVYIFGCTRPGFVKENKYFEFSKENINDINLKNLNEKESKKFSQILLNAKEIPEKLFSLLYKRSLGNPFYLEELTGRLIELKIITYLPRGINVDQEKLASLDLPPTLHGLLQAKIESLSRKEIDVLQRSSIFGRIFWSQAVFKLFGKSLTDEAINEYLDLLNQKLVLEKNSKSSFLGTDEYLYTQTLMKDVVYERVLLKERKKLHFLAAEWFIDQCEGREIEFASIIAGHFEQAKDGSAVIWFIKAGQAALKVYALEEALSNFSKAEDLNQNPQDRKKQIKIAYNLGKIYLLKSDFEKSLYQFEIMRDLTRELGDVSGEIESFYNIVRVYDDMGEFQKILDISIGINELILKSKKPLDKMRVLISQAKAYFRLGDSEKSFAFSTEVIDLAIKNNEIKMESEGSSICGMYSAMKGQYDKAIEYNNRSIKIEEGLGDRQRLMSIQNNMAIALYYKNNKDLDPVVKVFLELIETAKEIGAQNHEMTYHSNIAEIYLEMGEIKKAENSCLTVIDMVGQKETYFLSETYKILALSLLEQKRLDEATMAIEKAKNIAKKQQAVEYLGEIWRVIAIIGIALLDNIGEDSEFLKKYPIAKSFQFSISTLKSISHPTEQVKSIIGWSRFERHHGNEDQADQLWDEAKLLCIETDMDDRIKAMEEEEKRH